MPLALTIGVLASPIPSRPFDAYVSHDPYVLHVLRHAREVAARGHGMTISGEAGVGKSLLARIVHLHRTRRTDAMVVVEAPHQARVAHGWTTPANDSITWIVDHIDRWPKAQQAQLAQAASHRPSVHLIGLSRLGVPRLRNEGRLHPMLDDQIGHAEVHLPPLRARPDDLAPLVRGELIRYGLGDIEIDPEAWRALADHAWPDNIRELRRAVQNAATCIDRRRPRLRVDDFALDPLAPPSLAALADGTFAGLRRTVDAWYLRQLLHHADGNLSEAARRAACSRKVLRERLRRHGLYRAPTHDPTEHEPDSSACETAARPWPSYFKTADTTEHRASHRARSTSVCVQLQIDRLAARLL